MKPEQSPENEDVTPSKKKLKQARLPFKLLTETSPKAEVIQTRKRKLSVPDQQPVTKVGKIINENVINELVVVSDDESKDESNQEPKENGKQLNPFVKLVDSARKKKLQKSKKKKRGPKSKTNATVLIKDNEEVNEIDNDDVDTEMEVDTMPEPNETVTIASDKILSQNNSEAPSFQEKTLNKFKSVVSPTTPRRSARQKAESIDKSLNSSQVSSSEAGSNQNTPKRSTRSSSVVRNEENNTTTESPNNNLTPKQLQKKLEYAKKKEEREKKRQLEKEEKEKLKQEKEAQKKKEKEEKEEAKRKEKEEKEEQRRREKEEKEKQKELEKKLKEEKEEQKRKEKEEKEEQKKKEKEAKEEEKRKRQEALELEKQEQEHKKKKAAEAFVSFFVPKQKTEKDQITVGLSNNDMLSNFTIKADMRLAPAVRNPLTKERKQALEMFLDKQDVSELYIKSIRNGNIKPLGSGKTWPLSENDNDVMIVEDELPPIDGAGEIISCDSGVREKLRPKLLSFHENRRPPYWGTWRKKSAFINPRKPFKMDQNQLDYEVDSDEEWEEEDGESIDGSAAGSDDEQEPDEYEVDNEVFVPHGYLSDEEATMDDDDVLSLSPETQKAKLKHLEDEFESELKKPMEKLKPRLYGPLWETADGGKPEKCVDALWNYFSKVTMIMNDPTPLMRPSAEPEMTEKKKTKKKKKEIATDTEQNSPTAEKKKKKKVVAKGNKQKIEKFEKNQLGINAFLAKVKSS
ncbi:unnamed protein product [Leptosia nina]|uniref:Chromatin assembly factor 1 subunit A n=1 Tax=Leptosia nina TaxID=320188 RepID=A0AAV1IYE8_9NEOP